MTLSCNDPASGIGLRRNPTSLTGQLAMELRQLEYFIAIAETGAFSRAALRLCVGQSILSRQIKALEQEWGTELYHRTGRGIVLSEAGRILEQRARGRPRNSVQELHT